MDAERAQVIAEECGFEITAPLDVDNLKFREEVRNMCNAQQCPTGYDKCWSCPPALPELDEFEAEAKKYTQGIVLQTVGNMEDEFDFETIEETNKKHMERFTCLADRMREEMQGKMFPLGAGACPYCKTCTYPDKPCRYPDKKMISMEAAGLLVGEVCTDNGLKYNHGKNTIAFTSCCLF